MPELNLELDVLEKLRLCALEAGGVNADLTVIFGATVNASKAGRLNELGALVSRWMIDQSLTMPINKPIKA